MTHLRYKIIIIVIVGMGLVMWLISGGILSNNPSMMCYRVFDCVPSDISFLSCLGSDVIEDKTVMDYCADPDLVETTEGGAVKIKLPNGKTTIIGS